MQRIMKHYKFHIYANEIMAVGNLFTAFILAYASIEGDNFSIRFLIDDWGIPAPAICLIAIVCAWFLSQNDMKPRQYILAMGFSWLYLFGSIYSTSHFGVRGLFPASVNAQLLATSIAFIIEQYRLEIGYKEIKTERTQNELRYEELQRIREEMRLIKGGTIE